MGSMEEVAGKLSNMPGMAARIENITGKMGNITGKMGNMPIGSAGKEIPEEEYRTVFREIFENVGLPVEKLDEIELNYSPSIW